MITRSDRQKKESRVKRRQRLSRFSVIGDILLIIILLIAVAALFVLIRGRLEGSAPHLAGYRFYAVSGESMGRAFGAGSLVVVEPAAPEQLSAGDLIIVYLQGDAGRVCVCRIVGIDPDYGYFLTAGGEDYTGDETVKTAVETVGGRAILFVPYAGYILDFLQKPAGIILIVIIPALVVIVLQLRKLGRPSRRKIKAHTDENSFPGSSSRFDF